jgi:hypothetical protein
VPKVGRGGGFGTPHGTVTRALVSAGSRVVLLKVTMNATPGNTIFSDLGAEVENGQTSALLGEFAEFQRVNQPGH